MSKRDPFALNIQYYGLLEGAKQLFQPKFEEFVNWILDRTEFQFDVETNVTKYVRERKLITLQFGSVNEQRPSQWGLQWSYLTDEQKAFIKATLESHRWKKLIQNAAFEIMVCLNYDIRLRNVYDTMLAERILWCGYTGADQVSAALEDIVYRRFEYRMSKDEQTNFGDDFITNSKIAYMGRDVLFLDKIRAQQQLELHLHDLEFVAALENESVIGFAQIMWEGMKLDKDKWLANVEWARPLVEEAEQKLDKWLEVEPFKSRAIKLGYINTEDKLQINWNSNPQKKLIIGHLFPTCPGATKAVIQKWMAKGATYEEQLLIYEYLDGDKKKVEDYLLQHHRQWLVDNELLRPAGTAVLNWNSVDQVLPLIRIVAPNLRNMNADSMGKFTHPIGLDIEEYKDRLKLLSTYGEAFLKHVDPDGKVRTEINQIMTTGRISSSNPNLQNVTVTELVGTRYRNCFIPDNEDQVFVSSDYVSQELACIAALTRDKNWQDAIRKGQDLHSIASELVFGNNHNPYHISWKNAAEKDCAYYKPTRGPDGIIGPAKQKCKCPKHKIMRDACKSINFG